MGMPKGQITREGCYSGLYNPGHNQGHSVPCRIPQRCDGSNCESRIISFPNGKTLSGQAAQGLYEIKLQEEFAILNMLPAA
jgi:hypothetical protein